MKQCPTCRTAYTDETLRFCLADGTTLIEVGEIDTVVRSGVRVDIPTAETAARPTAASKSGNPGLKIIAAILLLGFLGLVVVGGAGVVYYLSIRDDIRAGMSPTPATSPTSSIDLERERLEQELANLQKQLSENTKTSPTKTPPDFEEDELPTARVNSPNDGFLALRSAPDTEYGERLAQIPHGTVITVESCDDERIKIGSRTGRWCLVTYLDQTGWVFDAWLDYE